MKIIWLICCILNILPIFQKSESVYIVGGHFSLRNKSHICDELEDFLW